MNTHHIIGVHITDRIRNAPRVQELFTQYGCNIRTRLGLHEVNGNHCSPHGLVILELFGEIQLCNELRDKLREIQGIQVQEMVFEHPE